jgi:hypothetical protein
MRFKVHMPKHLSPIFSAELTQAQLRFKEGQIQQSWTHLERAHIVGQPYPYAHSLVHWKMLIFGFRTKNSKEIMGQVPRLLVGGVKSFVGEIPEGNTGGANVPPLKRMPIPEDLYQIIHAKEEGRTARRT